MSHMKDTTVDTVESLGATIRQRRLEKGLTQVELARRIGVERKWVMRLESGSGAAEFGSVFKAMKALDLQLNVMEAPPAHSMPWVAPTSLQRPVSALVPARPWFPAKHQLGSAGSRGAGPQMNKSLDLAVTHLNAPFGQIVKKMDLQRALMTGSLREVASQAAAILSYMFVELDPQLILRCVNELRAGLPKAHQLYHETLEANAPRSEKWERAVAHLV